MTQRVLNLVERFFYSDYGEKLRVFFWEPLSGGCVNYTLKIDTNLGEFFLKWNTGLNPDTFLREAEGLKELEKANAKELKIPKVFLAKKVDDKLGFLLLEYLLPEDYACNYDQQLGRGLATIHAYSNTAFGFYTNNYCGATQQNNKWTSNWAKFFKEKRMQFLLDLIHKEKTLTAFELKIFDKLLRRIPQLLPEKSAPALIHGDLWSGNYMYTKQGVALIDPAAYYADREMEFSIMRMFGGFLSVFYAAYNEVLPLQNGWIERSSIYQIYHMLNHYYLFGANYKQQALELAKQFL